MDKDTINQIAWWIPNKKLRENIKKYMYKILDIDEKLNYINNNIEINNKNYSFDSIYTKNDYQFPLVCTSQICNQDFFSLPLFQYWSNKIIDYWNFYLENTEKTFNTSIKKGITIHRKLWEFVYIIQALYENNCLKPGKKGLAFGVGMEPLPALFASMGCNIVATDLFAETEEAKQWASHNLHAGNNLAMLNKFNICDNETFFNNVSLRGLDMNNIPDELNEQFDFNWSSCALEHIGGLDNSIDFIINNLKTLKSGGIAVHTTEYNLSSDVDTILDPGCVVFRKQDILKTVKKLEDLGHHVYPIDFRQGKSIADNFIGIPPFHGDDLYIRIKLNDNNSGGGGYIITSIGLIIKKK